MEEVLRENPASCVFSLLKHQSLLTRRPAHVRASDEECPIPLDTDGTPLFPELDLNQMAPAKVALIVKQFITQLYGMSADCSAAMSLTQITC